MIEQRAFFKKNIKTGANKSYWVSVSIFNPFNLTRTGDEMVEKAEIDF